MLKLGSLFDGIGGFCLAAERHGIVPVWASEIDEACQRVTARHFPNCKQLGDVTKIDGAIIEPVDVITFGSPCQDLSVAGKRKGLDGERSGLFRVAIDIIRAMRRATEGRYPRVIVWENVPGAFSSNAGQDFRAVLSEIAETEVPMPSDGKWASAGMVQCDDRQVCWRVLDAQYWGVPQRRKRIFLVASFGTRCAEQILFKQEGLRRYPETFQGEGETSAEGSRGCASSADSVARETRESRSYTLQLRAGASGKQFLFAPALSVDTYNFSAQEERTHPLRACDCFEPQTVCTPEEKIFCIQGNSIDRKLENGPRGSGVTEDVSYTLNTIDRHAVCVKEGQLMNGGGTNCLNPNDSQHNRLYTTDGPSPCLRAGTESIGQVPKIVTNEL